MSATFEAAEWNKLAVDVGKGSLRMVKTAHVILEKVTADGARDAQAFAPVDTGNLRAGIDHQVIGLEGEFFATAEYAPYVEEGTSVMAPHAFIGPAFDRQQPGFATAVAALSAEILT